MGGIAKREYSWTRVWRGKKGEAGALRRKRRGHFRKFWAAWKVRTGTKGFKDGSPWGSRTKEVNLILAAVYRELLSWPVVRMLFTARRVNGIGTWISTAPAGLCKAEKELRVYRGLLVEERV